MKIQTELDDDPPPQKKKRKRKEKHNWIFFPRKETGKSYPYKTLNR